MNKPTVLIVDDDPRVLAAIRALLEDDYGILAANSGKEALELVEDNGDIATVVLDIKMPDMDGIETGRAIRQLNPDIPVIFHTAYPGSYEEDEIDESERPFGYVEKASPVSRLLRSLRNAVNAYQSRVNPQRLAETAEAMHGIIGRSPAIQEVLRLISRVGPGESKVMILGETGTGKELVARAIHRLSARSEKRLAIFNCNHKSPDLVESELFGHERGAFTGAIAERPGLFEYADGGTVVLDEIGDLDLTTQAKLLRVLETGEYNRVGETAMRTTNVRVLCATHKDLPKMVDEGKFREDLYYRLKGIQISLPPLRGRSEDIPLLVERFIDRFTIEMDLPPKVLDRAAVDALTSFAWPGNVRQLLDTVEALVTMTESDILLADDVRRQLGLAHASDPPNAGNLTLSERIKNFKRSAIIDALSDSKGNVSAAGRTLGVDRHNLRKMILDLDIDLTRFPG